MALVPFQLIAAKAVKVSGQPIPNESLSFATLEEPLPAVSIGPLKACLIVDEAKRTPAGRGAHAAFGMLFHPLPQVGRGSGVPLVISLTH
jgi:hypothetical protein